MTNELSRLVEEGALTWGTSLPPQARPDRQRRGHRAHRRARRRRRRSRVSEPVHRRESHRWHRHERVDVLAPPKLESAARRPPTHRCGGAPGVNAVLAEAWGLPGTGARSRRSSSSTPSPMRASRLSTRHRYSWRSRWPVRRERFNSAVRANDARLTGEGVPLPLTQTQLASAVADRAEIPEGRGEASPRGAGGDRPRGARQRAKGPRWRSCRADRPGQAGAEERVGRNPATGEEITLAAKPRASTFARDRSPRPGPHCHQCRKHVGDSPPEPAQPSRSVAQTQLPKPA